MFVLGYFIWQALCSISSSERNSFGTLDGLKSKMVMWAFSFPFQHHDNVCQSWAPEDVGAPRVCRMRKKDPRQVNLIGNSTIPLAACMLTLFIFQKAKADLLWTKKLLFGLKPIFVHLRFWLTWTICYFIFFRYLLKALDMYWHEDCLKCGCCDCRLGEVGSTLYTKGNLLLCKRDYLR